MAAPTPSARTSPTGRPLNNGYRVLVNNSLATALSFFEESVTPPAIMGQDEMETTTQFNATWQTFSPQTLMRLAPYSMTGKYDPILYSTFPTICNKPAVITLHLPNGDSVCHYGFYKNFQPGALVRGTRPDATIEIIPTNQDPVTCEEEDPVYTAGTGTGDEC